MNAVEIEEAASQLAEAPFNADEFPFAFLQAFGNKETTIKKLRTGASNRSDVGGVLQRSNIHIAVAEPGRTVETVAALRASPQTERQKAKFVLSTDGFQIEAEEISSGEVRSFPFADLANQFGFFLPLAGISTVREVKNNPIDIKATGRLNRLYLQLLKDNADWGFADKRSDLNRFMARLIFCFFAEDTGIFSGDRLFTATIQQMSEADGSNTAEVIAESFRAMNLDARKGERKGVRPYADVFPFVNGGLFKDEIGCPVFSRTSRAYLIRAGELDWKAINPDIFGSMIQAVADDDERGELGMHYTSVPNIQKVLDPLFLDDLREQLEKAGTNKRMLGNLRRRLSRIRVFDPACGSGNFLVIAYIRMREIEDEIVRRRGEIPERSIIALTQFFGIEIKNFAAEIARLSLLIAEFQCDVRFIGQTEARALVLPLHATGRIVCHNALRINWGDVCPPTKTSVAEEDLGGPTGRLNLEDAGDDWETYICGNPPYRGSAKKAASEKEDLKWLFDGVLDKWGLFDYVTGWIFLSYQYSKTCKSGFAFVSTNTLVQGQHVGNFWKPLRQKGMRITFGVQSFKWTNLASNEAGVTVVCVGVTDFRSERWLYSGDERRNVDNINAYLLPMKDIYVVESRVPLFGRERMTKGNYYAKSHHLLFPVEEITPFRRAGLSATRLRKFYGSAETISGAPRGTLWFETEPTDKELSIRDIANRMERGRKDRAESADCVKNGMLARPHQFREMNYPKNHMLVVPVVSSERREYLPVDLLGYDTVISNKCFALYDSELMNLSLIASRIHLVWISTVCVRMRTDFSYSNTLGWNTFPVPRLTEQNKSDLTRCAEDILLTREAHFPATIADLYDPEAMPADLRAAHDRNDETVERIYIGRRFRNDTERLEKLFDMYTKMTTMTDGDRKSA
ncbi:class I SAM-dependent DNA methyltransferase [Aurantimonas sp. NFXS3]|uniref:class I SAM-dependent DNA methyltransferase n=1 Tax=Aurantimonas sp. NFXS3 TaxID=2818434 RepID=UPI003B8D9A60